MPQYMFFEYPKLLLA